MRRFEKTGRKRAFTLVELLVVIAIIGVLVSLLLPAVQSARESARRSSCQNNLKQIGIGLHNYHDTNRSFPSGGFLTHLPMTGGIAAPNHHTWLTSLLPFVEQDPLYDSTNLRMRAWGQPIVKSEISLYRCPSDGGYTGPTSEHQNIGLTNYAGAEGYHWWESAALDPAWGGGWTQLPQAGDYSGLFAVTRMYAMSSILDGTSNTIVAAETDSYGFKWGAFQTSGTGVRRTRGGESVFRSAFCYTSSQGRSMFPPYARPDGSPPPSVDGQWFVSAPYAYCPTYITAWGLNTEWPGASSNHSGGIVQALRGDASVGQYARNIKWGVWVAINGIADGSNAPIQ